MCDVREVDRKFLLDDTAGLAHALPGMTLGDVHPLDDDPLLAGKDTQDLARPALVAAADDDDVVALLDLQLRHLPAPLRAPLEDFGRQRHDLHEAARPQFAGHRTKDAGPDRLALIGDQHGGVAVEPNGAAVGAAYFFRRAYDDRAMHIALLDPATRDRLLDRDDDHIADSRGLALRAAQHFDALYPACAGIIGDVEICLHLDHAAPSAGSAALIPVCGGSSSVQSAPAPPGPGLPSPDRPPPPPLPR